MTQVPFNKAFSVSKIADPDINFLGKPVDAKSGMGKIYYQGNIGHKVIVIQKDTPMQTPSPGTKLEVKVDLVTPIASLLKIDDNPVVLDHQSTYWFQQSIREAFTNAAAQVSPATPKKVHDFYFTFDLQQQLCGVLKQEFIPGYTLREYVNDFDFALKYLFLCTPHSLARRYVSTSAKIFLSLIEKLERLHQNGIVHHDIKPDNIVIASSTSAPTNSSTDAVQAHLIDFGIATIPPRLYSPCPEIGLTSELYAIMRSSLKQKGTKPQELQEIGSYGYTAPELARAQSIGTDLSDYFSLGITVWETFMRTQAFPARDYQPMQQFDASKTQTLLDRIETIHYLSQTGKLALQSAISYSVVEDPSKRNKEGFRQALEILATCPTNLH